MKNIINEKPSYAELESKIIKHDNDCKLSLLIIFVLLIGLIVSGTGWLISSSDAKFYKDYKNEYFEKWKRCALLPQVGKVVDSLDAIMLRAREQELSNAENEFRVKQIQWEADLKVKEAMLDLRKEHLRLEREQEKFNNQAKAIDKVIKAAK